MHETRREATSFPGFSPTSLYWAREIGTVRREPWKRGWGRSKKAPVISPLFWLFPRSQHERCAPIGYLMTRVVLARFWHVCLEQNGRHAVHVLLTMLLEKALSLFPKLYQKWKEKQKNVKIKIYCLRGKMLLDIFHLGLKKAWFTNLVKFDVDRPHTTHKLVTIWNVAWNLFEQRVFPLFFLAAVFGHKLNFDWTNVIFFAALSLTSLRWCIPS